MTILVIEDSKLLRVGSSRALVKAGYQVLSAVDGEQGLRMARESIPDLILLDMLLPKVTGLDVLKALKGDARTANIPVIVLSGLSQANEAKLVKEGAAAFFVKSEKMLENDSADLVAAVRQVLAGGNGKGAGSKSLLSASTR
ncbi:MAG TPA: response regulator [Terriglobales bacterium]|jgi:DNA-binding response OmpR family regulator|nr:response regulator [Terriglobales bacterium]